MISLYTEGFDGKITINAGYSNFFHVSNQHGWIPLWKMRSQQFLQQCFVGSSEHRYSRYITIRWFMTLVAMARVINEIIIPATKVTKIVYNFNGALNQL